MITLKHLRHLQAIVKQGTIHGAAQALYLTQPALTRSIKSLEDSLGVKLFDRSKAGMDPTEFCLKIIARSQQLLLDVDDIQHEAEVYRNHQSGELRLATGALVGPLIIRGALPEFVRRYPSISVTVTEGVASDMANRLLMREVDLLIAGFDSYQDIDGIGRQRLKDIPIVVIVGPKHPLRQQKNIAVEDLLKYPMLSRTLPTASHPAYSLFQTSSSAVVVCSDHVALKDILLDNQAWLNVPALYYQKELVAGELCQLDFSSPFSLIELSIMELNGRSRTPAAQAFIEICESYFLSLDA